MKSSCVALARLWPFTRLVATRCVSISSLAITRRDTTVGRWLFACVRHLCPSRCFPVSNDLLHDLVQINFQFLCVFFFSSDALHPLYLPLQMSSCSSRALTILSTVFGACGLLLVGVAVSTDYWLIMVEGIILQQNQSMEVKMALHSGLWRVCFVAGREIYLVVFLYIHWKNERMTVENWNMCR